MLAPSNESYITVTSFNKTVSPVFTVHSAIEFHNFTFRGSPDVSWIVSFLNLPPLLYILPLTVSKNIMGISRSQSYAMAQSECPHKEYRDDLSMETSHLGAYSNVQYYGCADQANAKKHKLSDGSS
ncbi:uncharacterized protein LOC141901651 [Tubulanus polymorphus]|uniref:uncharacterized protein LOC141901651 n=1 Tax=Tubulanus polymorphus TaxID=672921 RepID=UPI003DA4638B